jgi:uncharacterized protein
MKLIYDYYNTGIIKSKGTVEKKMKEGTWMYYFENGMIEREVNYQNNIYDGPFKRWFKNGNLAIECVYMKGKLNGIWKEYYENGKLKETGEYINNEYKPKNFWNENGVQSLNNGTGKKMEKFGHNEIDIFEQYYKEGKLIKEIRV